MATPSERFLNSIDAIQVSTRRKFWLVICLVSFLCALGIFTESQFYAYTIGIHGTYAHIIYYVVGVTLCAAIVVLLIEPRCFKAFLEKYKGFWILKSFGDYLVMFTICFLSSGTGLPYLGLSSHGKAPSPAVTGASAPYRSHAFSEIAGLLASALLTVNALSIIRLLRTAEHNTFFGVAAALTIESAISLLYKYPYLTIIAAVFILAMTLLKDFLCCDQVVKADDNAAAKQPADVDDKAAGKRKAAGKQPADDKAGKQPADDNKAAGKHKAAGKQPADPDDKAAGKQPADKKAAGKRKAADKQPADDRAAGKRKAAGKQPADDRAAGKRKAAGKQPADRKAADKRPADEMV